MSNAARCTPNEVQQWFRGVELGAQGRAAAARTVLTDLDRAAAARSVGPVIASLAASTRGSLIRQAGRHDLARRADGRACLLAVEAGGPDAGEWSAAAWLDGAVGLAADALGVGDFTASATLLDRAARVLAETPDGDEWITVARARLRHTWVRTELALYRGDVDAARAARDTMVGLAADAPSRRHRVKSALIGAAVDAARGEVAAAVAAAERCAETCVELGLLPLEWAACTMLAGLSPDRPEYADRMTSCSERLTVLGMPVAPIA